MFRSPQFSRSRRCRIERTRFLAVEPLEVRQLLAVVAGISGPTTLVSSEPADYVVTVIQDSGGEPLPIDELLGDIVIQPTSWSSGLSIVRDVESHNGTIYIAGELNGKPAVQSFTVVDGVPVFAPVQVLAVPNASDGRGRVNDVAVVNGQVVFAGAGASSTPLLNGLTWDVAGEFTNHGVASEQSIVNRIGADGTLAGVRSDDAAIGGANGQMQLLPQVGTVGTALSVTPDGRILVGLDGFGGAAWRTSDPLSGIYSEMTSFDLSSFGTGPNFFTDVFSTVATGDIAFSSFLNTDLFVEHVGVWDVATGDFLLDLGAGELMDAKFFGDTLVLAINGLDGGFLTTYDHPEVTATLASLFPAGMGLTNPTFVKGGLYDGSLGVMVQDGTGNLATIALETNESSSPPVSGGNATFRLDWDGNGTVDEEVTGPSGMTVTHTFPNSGTANVKVQAVIGTEVSEVTGLTVQVTSELLQNGVLKVGGSANKDHLSVTNTANGIQVQNGSVKKTFTGVNRVEIFAGAGNDMINARLNVPIVIGAGDGNDTIVVKSPNTVVHGGAGNDAIFSSGAVDALFGEDGNDTIFAYGKLSVVVGGAGRDRLAATRSAAVLIGGNANLSSAALTALFTEIGKASGKATILESILRGNVVDDGILDDIQCCGKAWVVAGAKDRVSKSARLLKV